MRLRLVLLEEGGEERLSWTRPLKSLPGVSPDTLFRVNCALLVGEAEVEMREKDGAGQVCSGGNRVPAPAPLASPP